MGERGLCAGGAQKWERRCRMLRLGTLVHFDSCPRARHPVFLDACKQAPSSPPPKILFFARVFADIAGRLAPRSRFATPSSPRALLGVALFKLACACGAGGMAVGGCACACVRVGTPWCQGVVVNPRLPTVQGSCLLGAWPSK